jgi:pSer/pThr/pTyr-binding forkhead associated (FHA) protein
MPSERSDWAGPQPPNRLGQAGLGQAGLAEPPAWPGAAGAPVLVVRTRSAESRLDGGTVYRVGRDPKSDIVVADSRVSWRHGVLRLDGAAWIFKDAGSTNGTFIGSQRVDRSRSPRIA